MRLILGLLFLFSFQTGFNQEFTKPEFDILEHSIHLPHTFKTWRYKQALGFSLIYLPKDWLENAFSLPMVYYKSNFTLPKGFMIQADIKSILAASDFALGLSWNKDINSKLFIGAGYQASYGLGMLYDLGYDNTLTVVGHRPYIKLGYLYHDLTFTTKLGIDFSNKIQFDAGTTSLSGNIEFLNGYNFSIFMEQRMFKNKSFAIGYTSSFAKFHILGWPAFSYTKNMYYIPEFTTLFNF